VVRAFRYADERSPVWVTIARYPEATLAAGGIDQLRATTVVTADGRAMTEARFTIRNNLKPYLTVDLAENAEVTSAAIDGEPIKPSRDEQGRVLVPLVRSKSDDGALVPFRVQIVYEQALPALGLFGWTDLSMPKLDVPIASLAWKVLAPGGYETTGLSGDQSASELVKNATWNGAPGYFDDGEDEDEEMAQGVDGSISEEHRAALRDDRAAGAVPVRVTVPEKGNALELSTYWIDPSRPVSVRFYHARTAVVLGFQVFATLAMAALLILAARWSMARTFAHGGAALIGAGVASIFASTDWAIALAAVVLGRGRISALAGQARALLRSNYDAWKARTAGGVEQLRTPAGVVLLLGLAVRIVLVAIAGTWLTVEAFALIDLLGHPL
jgi:hypothetical protein